MKVIRPRRINPKLCPDVPRIWSEIEATKNQLFSLMLELDRAIYVDSAEETPQIDPVNVRRAYKATEVAKQLNVSPQIIYSEIKAGRLVARRVGAEYRITPEDINKYLDNPAGRFRKGYE